MSGDPQTSDTNSHISAARRALAIALSVVCSSGLGHFVLGRWKRGFFWFAAILVAWLTVVLGVGTVGLVGLALPLLVWVGAIVDVARVRGGGRELPGFGLVFGGWLVLSIGSIASALVIRVFIVEAFKMPSGSMAPTLAVGDHLFINKLASGEPPRRGDVTVFRFPENKSQDFIKRVIATPGDVLEVINGRPVLDGWLVPHCYVGPYEYDGRPAELFVEHLEDRSYFTLYTANPDKNTCAGEGSCEPGLVCKAGLCGALQGPFKVATGEAWVMGDNRNNSHDSRSWRGGLGAGVPFEDFKGPAMSIWMSFRPGGELAAERVGAQIHGPPALPPSMAHLGEALAECMRSRPPVSETTPPRRWTFFIPRAYWELPG